MEFLNQKVVLMNTVDCTNELKKPLPIGSKLLESERR